MRQRLAGAVWYTRKGETVVRELAASVENPQTTAQMDQRAILANLVAAYRANQFWMHTGAFETKNKTWSDYNAFVSANSKVNPPYLTKELVALGAGVVFPYTVTKGSLPAVTVKWYASESTFYSDLYLPADAPQLDGSTLVADLSAWLMAANNGLQEQDQLSVIFNYQRTGEDGTPFITARAYEIILDTSDTHTLDDIGVGQILFGDSPEGGALYNLCVEPENPMCGCTFVISRASGSTIKVSTQNLILSPEMTAYGAQYMTSEKKKAYERSYGSTASTNFLSPGYSAGATTSDIPMSNSITYISTTAGDTLPNATVTAPAAETDITAYFTSAIPDDATITPENISMVVAFIEGATGALRTTTLHPSHGGINEGRLAIGFEAPSAPSGAQIKSITIPVTIGAATLSYAINFTVTLQGAIDE